MVALRWGLLGRIAAIPGFISAGNRRRVTPEPRCGLFTPIHQVLGNKLCQPPGSGCISKSGLRVLLPLLGAFWFESPNRGHSLNFGLASLTSKKG